MENLVEQLQSLRCGEHLPDNRNGYWTKEQDEALMKSFDNGVGVSEIAITLGRTELSVIGRLACMGKFAPQCRPRSPKPKDETNEHQCKCPSCACKDCPNYGKNCAKAV